MKINIKKIVILGLLLSLALILTFLESLIPPIIPVPGFKIGLSQIGVLLAFYAYSIKEGAFISLGKTILASLITGTFFTFVFWVGLCGALVSLPCLYLGKKMKFSIYSVSIFGAIGHNVGQLLFISFSISASVAFFYLPFVLVASLVAGFLIGYLCKLIFPLLEKQLEVRK